MSITCLLSKNGFQTLEGIQVFGKIKTFYHICFQSFLVSSYYLKILKVTRCENDKCLCRLHLKKLPCFVVGRREDRRLQLIISDSEEKFKGAFD